MLRDFISNEERQFPFRVGKVLASSLAGFVAGTIFTSIIWIVALWYASQFGAS